MTKEVTVENINGCTVQEVFDCLAEKLLIQSKQCADENGMCMYTSKDKAGNIIHCSVGFLQTEKEEFFPYDNISIEELIESEGLTVHSPYIVDFLSSLQDVHDFNPNPQNWKTSLNLLASQFNLNSSLINTYNWNDTIKKYENIHNI